VLRTVPVDHVARGLQLASLPVTTRIDLATARDLAFRGAIRTVIAPSIHQLGDAFALTVRVLNADDGQVLVAKSIVAERPDMIIRAVSDVVDSVRRELGERPEVVAANRLLVEVATPSLPAFRKYVEAQEHFRRLDLRGCITAGNEAIQLDSQFASAWLVTGLCYGNAYVRDSAILAMARANANQERLNEVQRLNLEAVFAAWDGNGAAALVALDRAAKIDPEYHHNRAIILSGYLGRYEEAADAHARLLEASPFGPSALAYLNWARTLMAQGKFAEAESLDRLRPGDDRGTAIEFGVKAGRHEWDELARSALHHASHPGSTHGRRVNAAIALASAHAVRGRLGEGLSVLGAAIESATGRVHGMEEVEWFLWTVRQATGGSGTGPAPAARSQIGRAIWAASRGDSAEAFHLMSEARDSMPGRPIDALKREALASALVEMQRGRHEQVVALYAPDRSDWYQVERWWLLASSYHALGQHDSAAAYLHRLTAAEGIMGEGNLMVRGMVYPFAEFRLGLHYEGRGDKDLARTHFRAFLQTFSEPDPAYVWMIARARQGLAEPAAIPSS
jgi:tetratricopeptide (TPR) repeat protein